MVINVDDHIHVYQIEPTCIPLFDFMLHMAICYMHTCTISIHALQPVWHMCSTDVHIYLGCEHKCTNTYIHIHWKILFLIFIYTHTHTYIHTHVTHVRTYKHTYIYTYTHTYIYIYTPCSLSGTHTHKYLHTYPYTHTYIHILHTPQSVRHTHSPQWKQDLDFFVCSSTEVLEISVYAERGDAPVLLGSAAVVLPSLALSRAPVEAWVPLLSAVRAQSLSLSLFIYACVCVNVHVLLLRHGFNCWVRCVLRVWVCSCIIHVCACMCPCMHVCVTQIPYRNAGVCLIVCMCVSPCAFV
jgi:hypothetical protein